VGRRLGGEVNNNLSYRKLIGIMSIENQKIKKEG
jgi:hypothetical protein